jgi:hypothetical protein
MAARKQKNKNQKLARLPHFKAEAEVRDAAPDNVMIQLCSLMG